jgi:hypothetical protein
VNGVSVDDRRGVPVANTTTRRLRRGHRTRSSWWSRSSRPTPRNETANASRSSTEAGIKHFWLARSFALTGIHHDTLQLHAPFDIDIDLTEIDRL